MDNLATENNSLGTIVVPVVDEVTSTRKDIEQTRANMSETLDAIKEKLNPQQLMDQAKDTVLEMTSSMTDKAKSALHDVADDVKTTVHTIVSDVSDHAKETAKDAATGAVSGAMGEVSGAVGAAIDSTKKAGSTIMYTVKNNPIPTILLFGAGWYLLNNRKQPTRPRSYSGESDYRMSQDAPVTNGVGSLLDAAMRNPIPAAILVGTAYHLYQNHVEVSHMNHNFAASERGALNSAGDRISETLHEAGDKASDAVDGVKGTLSDAVGTVKDALGSAASSVKDTAGSAATTVKETAVKASDAASNMVGAVGERAKQSGSNLMEAVNKNPLTAGVWALGIGATIALLLPDTEPENNIMGKTRDNLLDTAQKSAGELIDNVHVASTKVIDSVDDSISQMVADGISATKNA